ncbi:NAD(P)/FAD-dependent oxidoreductase [Bacillus salipaludis]|uniref:NAD(P)/FAD-dependent oxidoreductase n=1 Tax=Bacillus salipaludis TaxID=2547811 RepID=A0ABW8RC87_9BACI
MKIVVVGAGIVGASTAYHLARSGMEVVIIDQLHEGQATAAGAGIVCPWITRVEDDDWFTLAKGGACYYPSLIAQLGEDGENNLGYGLVGALAVSNDEEELNTIEQKVRKRQAEIPNVGEVSRLSPEEARKLFPPLRDDLAAVHVTGAARVDGKLLRDAMLNGAKKHGAVQVTGLASLTVVEGKVTGIQVNGNYISADSVVITAGAWASEILEPFGVRIPVEPQKGQIAHLKLTDQDTSKWPVILPQGSHYMVCFDDSRVVVGATRETGSGFDYRVTAAGIKEVIEEALFVAPGLADSTLHEVRIGFRPAGPDILPLLGTVPTLEGVVIATGLGASGLTMGPYVGTLAAKLALQEELNLDLTPYNPFRIDLKV